MCVRLLPCVVEFGLRLSSLLFPFLLFFSSPLPTRSYLYTTRSFSSLVFVHPSCPPCFIIRQRIVCSRCVLLLPFDSIPPPPSLDPSLPSHGQRQAAAEHHSHPSPFLNGTIILLRPFDSPIFLLPLLLPLPPLPFVCLNPSIRRKCGIRVLVLMNLSRSV